MRSLLKVILLLAAVFASTFIIARLAGFLSLDDIRTWFESLHEVDPHILYLLVAALLFSDLFIAIPTLSITILSGYFLGFGVGSAAAITGMMLAGTVGYGLEFEHHPVCDDRRVFGIGQQLGESATGDLHRHRTLRGALVGMVGGAEEVLGGH